MHFSTCQVTSINNLFITFLQLLNFIKIKYFKILIIKLFSSCYINFANFKTASL